MKRELIAFFILILLFQTHLNAQEIKEKSFWGSVELMYGIGLRESGKSISYTIKNRKDYGGVLDVTSIRIKAGYYIKPQLSVGMGTGIFTYSGTSKLIPVFADIRYYIKKLRSLYTFADVGASFFDFGNVSKGFITDLGVGYKIRLGKNFSLNPSIGYNLFAGKGKIWGDLPEQIKNESRIRHSIFAGLSFEF
jgi:hypothetical protein